VEIRNFADKLWNSGSSSNMPVVFIDNFKTGPTYIYSDGTRKHIPLSKKVTEVGGPGSRDRGHAARAHKVGGKGLKGLYSDGSSRGVPPDAVDKLQKMFAYLDAMEDPEELRNLAAWKAQTLTGDRKGTWSLSVTTDLRLTFGVDIAGREIYDVNLEDYQ
jgi:proteic killer suppression protein